jgi:hypothetical protein
MMLDVGVKNMEEINPINIENEREILKTPIILIRGERHFARSCQSLINKTI